MQRSSVRRMAVGLGVLVLVVGLVLSGGSSAMAKERSAVKIGTHLPLSGAMASLGKEQLWAYKTAVEDINKAGGVFVKEVNAKLPVELITMDDESDPGKGAAAVERLVKQHKVDAILSGQSAPFGVIPGCIAAEKYKKYYHASACVVPAWKEQEFKWSTLLWYDIAQGTSIPFHVWNAMKDQVTIQKPALFMEDTFDGRAMNGILKKNAEEMGYKIALEEYCAPGSKDYSAQIIKARSLGIDAVILFANTSDCVTFVRQMKENNFNVKNLIGYKGTWAAEFYESVGKDADYMMADSNWHENLPFKGSKELGERFTKEFSKSSTCVGLYYGLTQVLCQAIEKADSLESADIRKAVMSGSYDTVTGKVTYGNDGVAIYTLVASQWKDNIQTLAFPFEWANGYKVKAIPEWDKR